MSRRSDSTLSDISSQSLSPRRNSLSSLINSISQVAVRKEIAERLKNSSEKAFPLVNTDIFRTLKDLAIELYSVTHFRDYELLPIEINKEEVDFKFSHAVIGCLAFAKAEKRFVKGGKEGEEFWVLSKSTLDGKYHSGHRRVPDIVISDSEPDEEAQIGNEINLGANLIEKKEVRVKVEPSNDQSFNRRRSPTVPQTSNEKEQSKLANARLTEESSKGRQDATKSTERLNTSDLKRPLMFSNQVTPPKRQLVETSSTPRLSHSVQNPINPISPMNRPESSQSALQKSMELVNSRELEIFLLSVQPPMAQYARILFHAGLTSIQAYHTTIKHSKVFKEAVVTASLAPSDHRFLFELLIELNALRSR